MSKVCAFLADGLEEVECLAVVDILRRAEVEVTLVSISNHLEVTGSHNITIKADVLFKDAKFSNADLLFLPGGMPGTKNLGEHKELSDLLLEFDKSGKRIAAICAAPSVLGTLHLLTGKTATCYPGFEDKLIGATRTSAGVITDKNITTARGLGFAIDLGLELVSLLEGNEMSNEIKSAIQYN